MLRKLSYIVFSFEMIFVLYLFAGRYKTDPRFDWVPIDLTLFFLLFSVAIGAWILVRGRLRFRRCTLMLTGCMGVFLGYCLASYYWTPSEAYAKEKLLYLWILTFWPFLACAFIISRDFERLKRFAAALVFFSVWVAVESVLGYTEVAVVGQQVSALGGNYLGLGRVIGLAALVLLMYGIAIGRQRGRRWGALLAFGGYLFVLLILGGRGPLLATCLPALVPRLYGLRFRKGGRVAVARYTMPLAVSLVVGGLATVYFASTMVLSTLKRMTGLLTGSFGASTTIRLDMYQQALRIWGEHPFIGAGIGGWPVLAGGGDVKMYPHNIILEVLAELGLIGLSLLCLLIGVAFRQFWKNHDLRRSPWAMLVLLLFLNTFLNAMVTGDLTDNRIVFAFLGLFVYKSEHETTSSRWSPYVSRRHRQGA